MNVLSNWAEVVITVYPGCGLGDFLAILRAPLDVLATLLLCEHGHRSVRAGACGGGMAQARFCGFAYETNSPYEARARDNRPCPNPPLQPATVAPSMLVWG